MILLVFLQVLSFIILWLTRLYGYDCANVCHLVCYSVDVDLSDLADYNEEPGKFDFPFSSFVSLHMFDYFSGHLFNFTDDSTILYWLHSYCTKCGSFQAVFCAALVWCYWNCSKTTDAKEQTFFIG